LDKVLVTGGAGFIGSNIAHAFVGRGYDVVAFDNLSTGTVENLAGLEGNSGFQLVKGDVLDYQALVKAASGARYLLHLAALPSVAMSIENPELVNKVNVEGTIKVLLAAREAGVEKVVVASSTAVYGDALKLPVREDEPCRPLSPYAVSKAACEGYAEVLGRLEGLPVLCLRYFNVYGPRQSPAGEYAAVIPRFITAALEGRPLVIYGDGEQTRDFVFVEDVVEANLLAMTSSAVGVLNIASGRAISINELARKIVELTSSASEIVHVEAREGEIRHSVADISKARRELGFEPSYSIEGGLKKTIQWFRRSSPGKAR